MAERRLTEEQKRKLEQRIGNDRIVAARLSEFNNLQGLNVEGVERNPVTGFYRQPVLPRAINLPRAPAIPGREERPTKREIALVDLSNTHLDAFGNTVANDVRDRTFDEYSRRYPVEENVIEQLEYKAHAINLEVDRMIGRWKRTIGGNNLTNAELDAIVALLPPNASVEQIETLMHRFKPTVTIWSIIKDAVKLKMYKALIYGGNINIELDKMISKYPSLMSCLTIACFPRKYHIGDEYCKLSGNIKCATETCCNILAVYLGGIVSNAIFEEIMRQISMIPEMVISKQPGALGGRGKTNNKKKKNTKKIKSNPNNKKGGKKQTRNDKTKNNRR